MDNKEIEETLFNIQRLQKDNKSYEIPNITNIDILILPSVVSYLKNITQYFHPTLLWLNLILNNPFEIKKILNKSEMELLTEFLIKCSKSKIKTISKEAINNISLIITNISISENISQTSEAFSNAIKEKIEAFKTINNDPIASLQLIKHLSKVIKIPETYFIINHEDCDTILRLKLKIISFQALKSHIDIKNTIEAFNSFLRHPDSKVGWSLSKCYFRILKIVDEEETLDSLRGNLITVFANEQLWINISTIVSLSLLNGHSHKGSENIYMKMIFYDVIGVSKSSMVREAGLFNMWAVAGSSGVLDVRFFYSAILVALFDNSLQCRRAAASIILEFIGKFRIVGGSELLDIINFHTVQRQDYAVIGAEKIATIIPEIRANIICYLKSEVSQYHVKRRDILARALAMFDETCICGLKIDSSDYNSLNFLFVFAKLRVGNICSDCTNKFTTNILTILNFSFKPKIVDYVDSANFMSAYYEFYYQSLNFFECDTLYQNILFSLEKSLKSRRLIEICSIIHDSAFNDAIFARLSKRNSDLYILANANNKNHIDGIINHYKKNTATKKKLAVTMRAINLGSLYPYFKDEIYNALDDYSVDFTGDLGMQTRYESFLMISVFDISKFNHYFFRFIVDKSKYIRDLLILHLLELNHSVDLVSMNIEVDKYLLNTMKNSKSLNEFSYLYSIIFKEEYDMNELGMDSIHFHTCFKIFRRLEKGYQKEFLCGILSTLRNSCTAMYNFIFFRLFNLRGDMIVLLIELITDKTSTRNINLGILGLKKLVEAENSSTEMKILLESRQLYDALIIASINPILSPNLKEFIIGDLLSLYIY